MNIHTVPFTLLIYIPSIPTSPTLFTPHPFYHNPSNLPTSLTTHSTPPYFIPPPTSAAPPTTNSVRLIPFDIS